MKTPQSPTSFRKLIIRHRRLIVHHLLPLLAYTILAIIFTWPVAANFTTQIPGGGDAPWFLWQFWWFKYALLDLQQLPYTTNLIFYPLTDVPVMAQTPVNEIFTIPIQVAFSLVILNNLLFFLSYTLSGYFTYLLGWVLVRRRDLAFLGGIFFAFCAYRGMRGWGHMSLLTTQWMPLTLLLAHRLWYRPTQQRGLALGIAAALVALASPYYIGLFLLPVGGAAAIYLASRRLRGLWRWRLWRAMAVAGTVIVSLTVVAYLHYFYLEEAIYTMTWQLSTEAMTYSADLLSWLLPPAMNPIWQHYTWPIYAHFTTPNLMETTVFAGYLPLCLLVLACFLRSLPPSTRFWQLLAVISIILSLGPTLHIAGVAYFDWLPYRFLLAIPGFESFRIPSRAGITAALALSMLSILILHKINWPRHRRVQQVGIGVLAALFLLNNLPGFPHPLTDAQIPAIYQSMEMKQSEGALLALPAGEFFASGDNFFAEVSQAMYDQSEHHKPLVSGYLGRRPSRLREPEQTLPFVRRFFNDLPNQSPVAFPPLRGLPDPFWPADIDHAPTLLAQAGIGAVTLHCGDTHTYSFCQGAIPLLNHALGLATEISGDDRLYLVQPPPYQQQRLPDYFTNLALAYDKTFSRLDRERFGRVYEIKGSGTIRFTVPFTGRWQMQGELVGTQINAVKLTLDQKALDLTYDNYSALVKSWQTAVVLTAGVHEFHVQTTVTEQVTEGWRCTQHCLRNFTVRLVQPQSPTETEPLTTLVDSDGQQATLLKTQLLQSAPHIDPSHQAYWLMTSWQLDAALTAQLQQRPARLPALFIHLTDATGTTQLQADHQLGERYLYMGEAGIFYDFVPLPLTPTLLSTLEVRLGLWYPATGAYYWSITGTNIDSANRLRVGALTARSAPLQLPNFPIDPRHYATFMPPTTVETLVGQPSTTLSSAPSSPISFTEEELILLSAQVISSATDVSTPQLVTTWRVPYNFNTRNNAELFVELTDTQGKLLARLKQALSAHNRIEGESEFVVDTIDLPALSLPPTTVIIHLRLWYPPTATWYTLLDRPGDTANPQSLRLGTWADLMQFSMQP